MCSSGDADAIRDLEEFFSSVRWERGLIERELADPTLGVVYLGAFFQNLLAGYSAVQRVPEELYLMNIVVHGDYRRHGVGASLLVATFETGGYLGCSKIRLVVRSTNANALSFYTGLGFSNTGRMVRYYSDGADGIGMERSLEDERQWWRHQTPM